MMRLFKYSMITLLAGLLVNTTASAIEVSQIGGPIVVDAGVAFTIDLALDNASATSTVGFDISLSGLAAAEATVTGGQSALAYFAFTCVNPTDPTQCFGSIQSVNNAFFNPNDLSSGNYTQGDDSLRVLFAAGTPATSQTGAADPGIDGGSLTVPSTRDVTLSLVALTPGVYNFVVDGTYADGTNELPIQSGAVISVTVVPEPGTALLMGLGLAGLTSAGRRK